MKWSSLLFAVVACLAVGPAIAQEDMRELTLAGTVVSHDARQLVLDTDTGRRTFVVDKDSNLPLDLAVGSRVDVVYHDLGDGSFHVAAATVIVPADPVTTAEADPAPVTDPVTATTPTADVHPHAGEVEPAPAPVTTTSAGVDAGEVEPVTAATTSATADIDEPAPVARELPATASSLPLVGLVGLLALAGGMAVRFMR